MSSKFIFIHYQCQRKLLCHFSINSISQFTTFNTCKSRQRKGEREGKKCPRPRQLERVFVNLQARRFETSLIFFTSILLPILFPLNVKINKFKGRVSFFSWALAYYGCTVGSYTREVLGHDEVFFFWSLQFVMPCLDLAASICDGTGIELPLHCPG